MLSTGHLDAADRECEDLITHFEEVARQITKSCQEKTRLMFLGLHMDEMIALETQERKNPTMWHCAGSTMN